MAGVLSGVVKVLFQGDASGLTPAARDAVRQLTQMQRQVMGLSSKMQGAFNLKGASQQTTILSRPLGSVKEILMYMAAWKGGSGLFSAFGKLFTAASDLNEQLSASQATFGDSAKIVTGYADQMAKSFGIVKSEFLEAANSLGGIFKASGFSTSEAATMSAQYAKLAADLGSFKNLDFGIALEKLRSGLVGEAEPLRAVGVLLSESAVKQEAYLSGIAKVGTELTEQQKVMARSAIIMRSLSDASGDLERTQSGVANRAREVRGRLINLAADLGMAIRPLTESLLGGLAYAFTKIANVVDTSKGGIEQWARSAVQAGGWFHESIKGIGNVLGYVIDTAELLYRTFVSIFAGLVRSIATVGALFGGFGLNDLANQMEDMVTNLHLRDFQGNNVRGFFNDLAKGASNVAPQFQRVNEEIQRTTLDALKLTEEIDKLTGSLNEEIRFSGLSDQAKELAKLAEKGATQADLLPIARLMEQKLKLENASDFGGLFAEKMSEAARSLPGMQEVGSREAFASELYARTGIGRGDDGKKIAGNTEQMVRILTELKGVLASARPGVPVGGAI